MKTGEQSPPLPARPPPPPPPLPIPNTHTFPQKLIQYFYYNCIHLEYSNVYSTSAFTSMYCVTKI